MSKSLRNAIENRAKRMNKYNKSRTDDNWLNYKKQRNFCVSSDKQTVLAHFYTIPY